MYTDISNIFREHFKDSRFGKTDYIMGICLLSSIFDFLLSLSLSILRYSHKKNSQSCP